MTNLPITSNNPQPSAKVASTARKDDATKEPSAGPFGAVLARQMDEANASASNTPSSATGVDTKKGADSAAQTGKAEQDKVPPATSTSGDPSSALAAMLQIPQEIKTAIAKDSTRDTSQASTRIDQATAASGKSDAAVMIADGAVAGAFKSSDGKVAANQLVDSASQANAKIDLATAASGKSDAAVGPNQLADNINAPQTNAKTAQTTAASGKSDAAIMATDKSALHNGSGLEITKFAEPPNSLPSAAQSAQGPALSAASMATSGISSDMLANNKAADSLQTISSPLGSRGWSDEFSQKISWMSTQRNQVAELHLNPPNLGPLDVVLKISDNQATALFSSPHSAVRDAVENAMPKLREMLADNGITLGNTMVSDQPPRDRGANGFLGNGSGTATQRESADGASRLADLSPATAQPVPMRRHNGMVDTFA